jgi:hypothetical protein
MDRFIEIAGNVDVGCTLCLSGRGGPALHTCNSCEWAYPSLPRMSAIFRILSTLAPDTLVAPEISRGDLPQALLVCLTSQIGWPNFRRMYGADGTAETVGAPFGI